MYRVLLQLARYHSQIIDANAFWLEVGAVVHARCHESCLVSNKIPTRRVDAT